MSEIWNDVLEDVRAEDQRIALSRGTKEANRCVREGDFEGTPKSARVRGRVSIRMPKGDDWKDNSHDGENATHFLGYWPQRGGGLKYPLEATFDWPDDGGGSGNEIFEMPLTPRQAKWIRRRAWIHAFIRLPALNDHFAPIAIALLALASPFIFN